MCYLIAISPLTATFLAFVKLKNVILKNISKLRPMLSISNAEMLINAFMCMLPQCKIIVMLYWVVVLHA